MRQMIDRVRAQRDPVYFAKALIRCVVHAYQAALLRCDKPTSVEVWGRGYVKPSLPSYTPSGSVTQRVTTLWCT